MRMWMLPPESMCRKHLLGEHLELHMLTGALRKGKNISGFINKGLVSPKEIISRHDDLVSEMLNRRYNHKSWNLSNFDISAKIDINKNKVDLITRCKKCKKRNEFIHTTR